MSSTNRGSIREVSDYYVTPIPEIKKFLRAWDNESFIQRATILDPCAGGDVRNRFMAYPSALKELYQKSCTTIDIRDDSLAEIKEDYLERSHFTYNMIITNPPFSLAQQIAEKALREIMPMGYVVLLLRLNFFGSQKRFRFWQEYKPQAVFIHNKRLCFTGDGKTDSIEYMHCVWQKGHTSNDCQLMVI